MRLLLQHLSAPSQPASFSGKRHPPQRRWCRWEGRSNPRAWLCFWLPLVLLWLSGLVLGVKSPLTLTFLDDMHAEAGHAERAYIYVTQGIDGAEARLGKVTQTMRPDMSRCSLSLRSDDGRTTIDDHCHLKLSSAFAKRF